MAEDSYRTKGPQGFLPLFCLAVRGERWAGASPSVPPVFRQGMALRKMRRRSE